MYKIQRLKPVIRDENLVNVQLGLLQNRRNTLANHRLIIYNQNINHAATSFIYLP
ncbi:hypothetical protein D3C84_972650 [compost metagenome]